MFNRGLIIDLPLLKIIDAPSAASGVGPLALLSVRNPKFVCVAGPKNKDNGYV
jgi:hypothetical protein